MIRYEVLYWPEKDGRAIIRYQKDGKEKELSAKTIGTDAYAEVLESEIDTEIERIDAKLTDPKEKALLRTNQTRKRIREAMRDRKREAEHRVLAARRMEDAAQLADEFFTDLIGDLNG